MLVEVSCHFFTNKNIPSQFSVDPLGDMLPGSKGLVPKGLDTPPALRSSAGGRFEEKDGEFEVVKLTKHEGF